MTAHVLLKVLGESAFDETYGTQQVSDHITVNSDLVIDSQTLDVMHFKVGALFEEMTCLTGSPPKYRCLRTAFPVS